MIRETMSWFESGGPVMPAILVVGVLLYTGIADRIWALYIAKGQASLHAPTDFARGLLAIRTLVATAPLLGLLGTVTGMIGTFNSMEVGNDPGGISFGISHSLRTTQYGLAIAAPALLAERMLSRRSEFLEKHAGKRS